MQTKNRSDFSKKALWVCLPRFKNRQDSVMLLQYKQMIVVVLEMEPESQYLDKLCIHLRKTNDQRVGISSWVSM